MKIYEIEDNNDNLKECIRVRRFHEDIGDSLYENGVFLKHLECINDIQETFDKEDLDDGYEIIVVNNASKRKNFRTLKSAVKK